MKQQNVRKTSLIALGLVAAATGLAGCEGAAIVTQGFAGSLGPVGLVGGAAVATTAEQAADGPRLTFENATGTPLEVRWWVGRVDVREPSGVADLRTAQHLGFTAHPRYTVRKRCERQPWPTGTVDAVVRAEIREVTNDGSTGGSWWLELPRPGPYYLRAQSIDGAVVFDRPRDNREVVAMPEEQCPIGRNGPFPVYAERVSMGN